ncbi:MAG: aminotransferase class IV [Bacteroidia bacterium]|nr:aminotransferase class IV [Bacteroidia bacterium]
MSRASLYGDLFFETILFEKGEFPLLELHVERIRRSAEIMEMELPEHFSVDYLNEFLVNSIPDPSKIFRLRLVIRRAGLGFYAPVQNKAEFEAQLIGSLSVGLNVKVGEKLANQELPKVAVFNKYYKPCHSLSNVKSGNALIYVMALKWAKEMGLDDVLILNEYKRICEGGSSNVFWVKNDEWFTPPLEEGPVDGVMRLKWMSMKRVTQKPCSIEELRNADRIFLSNSIQGMKEVAFVEVN